MVLSRFFSGTKEGTEWYFGGTLRYFRGTPRVLWTVPCGSTITVNDTFVEVFLTCTVPTQSQTGCSLYIL